MRDEDFYTAEVEPCLETDFEKLRVSGYYAGDGFEDIKAYRLQGFSMIYVPISDHQYGHFGNLLEIKRENTLQEAQLFNAGL